MPGFKFARFLFGLLDFLPKKEGFIPKTLQEWSKKEGLSKIGVAFGTFRKDLGILPNIPK